MASTRRPTPLTVDRLPKDFDDPLVRAMREVLADARKRAGLGVNELARRSGLDASVISRFETGQRGLPYSPTQLVAAYAGTTGEAVPTLLRKIHRRWGQLSESTD